MKITNWALNKYKSLYMKKFKYIGIELVIKTLNKLEIKFSRHTLIMIQHQSKAFIVHYITIKGK